MTPKFNRIDWIDQVKGLTIFLVVYGHNFPITEKYIYSFHMPLFIMVAGFFHPSKGNIQDLKKRFKHIILPYFLWASFLFFVWYIIGGKMGESAEHQLSVSKNFLGIFYAQGGRFYMDWGIPLWFLPSIFMTFFFYYLIQKIENHSIKLFVLILLISVSFIFTRIYNINLPFSINIALVSLLFYAFGNLLFNKINDLNQKQSIFFSIVFGLFNLFLYNLNDKVDMYRSIYGNEFLFIINGITGSLFIIFLFKSFPKLKFLGFIGKFSLVILALQLLAMSAIKLFLWKIIGDNDFDFNEFEKFTYSIIQILILIPTFYFINKFVPTLNGGHKKI